MHEIVDIAIRIAMFKNFIIVVIKSLQAWYTAQNFILQFTMCETLYTDI